MRTLTLVLSSLFLCSTATATEIGGTLSLELSNLHNGDTNWDLFSGRAGMPGRGLRGGVRIGDHLSVEASWQRVRRGATVSVGGVNDYTTYTYDYDYDSELATGSFQTAWFSDHIGIGPRLTHGFFDVIYPYAGIEGTLLRGVIKIDDDPNSKSNDGQLTGSGSGLGATALGGIELRTPTAAGGLQAALFIDAGYAIVQTLDFGDLGARF